MRTRGTDPASLGLSATDLANHLACRHLTTLDLGVDVDGVPEDLLCDRCDSPVAPSRAVQLRAVCGEGYDRLLHPECWMHVRGALELICDVGHAAQAGFEPIHTWTDRHQLFSVHYLRRA